MGFEIDFLSVGEGEKSGDAIALRFGNLYGNRSEQTVVVIDGGFKDTGANLVTHINNYYLTDHVDLVISTHPDSDHASGLEVVLEKMKVGLLWMHRPWNHTDDIAKMFKDGRVTDNSVRESLRKSLDTVRNLEQLAVAKGVRIVEPFAGDEFKNDQIRVIGPTEIFYENLLPDFRGTPEPEARRSIVERAKAGTREFISKVAESFSIETLDDSGETSAENNSSVVTLFVNNGRYFLFTGDAGIPALTEVANRLETEVIDQSNLIFIQVPHHGSKRNVGPTILNRLIGLRQSNDQKQKTAIVSASKDGEPKHPSKKVTNAFRRRGAWVFTTQGKNLLESEEAPVRENYLSAVALPFYEEVEE